MIDVFPLKIVISDSPFLDCRMQTLQGPWRIAGWDSRCSSPHVALACGRTADLMENTAELGRIWRMMRNHQAAVEDAFRCQTPFSC